jgi:(p)ppGpp synthase/HD superfamily hydrolase
MEQNVNNISGQGMFLFKQQDDKQNQVQHKEIQRSGEKANQFSFTFEKENEIDNELRKPRSRAYMELFDAIDMLSATDEEIIEQLKANMDEDTVEEFSNMTAEELLEEIKACFQEEFQNVQIEMKSILLGVLSKCYIDGCDCHAISSEGDILDHYNKNASLPEGMEKGRIIYNKYPKCRCVEVYSNCCRVVNEDSTVIKISDSEI